MSTDKQNQAMPALGCIQLVRLLVWRGIPGRLCAGPYWVTVPIGETIEQSRWTDSASWVQGLSDWRRDKIKRLFGATSEDDFERRYPSGATIATDGRFNWRRLGLPNVTVSNDGANKTR